MDHLQRAMENVNTAMNGHNDVSKKTREATISFIENLERQLADLKLQRRDLDLRIQDVETTISAEKRMLELLPRDDSDVRSFQPSGRNRQLVNQDKNEQSAA